MGGILPAGLKCAIGPLRKLDDTGRDRSTTESRLDFTGFETLKTTKGMASTNSRFRAMGTVKRQLSVNEDDGSITLSMSWRSPNGSLDASLYFTTVSGTASAGSDFIAVNYSKSYLFTPNYITIEFKIDLIDDGIGEPSKFFTFYCRDQGSNLDITDGTADRFDAYEYKITILDRDTGIRQPDGSIVGQANPNIASKTTSFATDALGYSYDAFELARDLESKIRLNGDIPSGDITNVKYSLIDNLQKPDALKSQLNYGKLGTTLDIISKVQTAYNAFSEAEKILNSTDGTYTDAARAAGTQFTIAVASGAIGRIIGGAATGIFLASTLSVGAPVFVGVAIGLVVGNIVSGVIDSYATELARENGLLAPPSLAPMTAAPALTSVINKQISFGASAPTPAWEFNPVTKEFHWFEPPSSEQIQEISTRLGLSGVTPINKKLFGDLLPDKNDLIYAGSGDDTIASASGNDVVFAQAGSDAVNGGSGNDALDGGQGNDVVRGGADNDLLDGGEDDDRLLGEQGNDRLWGRNGRDRLDGGAGDDDLRGGTENDLLSGGDGNDIVSGGDGDDQINGDAGIDTLDGGAGIDTITYAFAPTAVLVTLGGISSGSAGGWATGDLIRFIENVIGSAYDDTISDERPSIASANNFLIGGAGNDILVASSGEDILDSGSGNDRLTIVHLSAGDFADGGDGQDTMFAGDQKSSFSQYLILTDRASLKLAWLLSDGSTTATYTVASSIEYFDLTTGSGDDILDASRSASGASLRAGSGSDTIIGSDLSDTFEVYGLGLGDNIQGNGGIDRLEVFSIDGGITDDYTISGESSLLVQVSGVNVASEINILRLHTGDGNDRVDAEAVTALGMLIDGGVGSDNLLGGSGNDEVRVKGLHNGDLLAGGAGIDLLRVEGEERPSAGFEPPPGTVDQASISDNFVIFGGSTLSIRDPFQTGGSIDDLLASGFEQIDLNTGGGNDYLDASQALISVSLNGGGGDDVLVGGQGNDVIFGDTYEDADGGHDLIYGGSGDDRLSGVYGADEIFGEDGNDLLIGRGTLKGGSGNDRLVGVEGDGVLEGDDGNDSLEGGPGNDVIRAGVGNDKILLSSFPEFGSDTIDGGLGIDQISWGLQRTRVITQDTPFAYNLVVDLSAGAISVSYYWSAGFVSVERHSVSGVENIIGLSQERSELTGDDSANRLEAGGLGSIIRGMAGDDQIIGGEGHQRLEGGAGSDVLRGRGGDDVLSGGGVTGDRANKLYGDDGSDTVSYDGLIDAVLVDLRSQSGRVTGVLIDKMNSIENAIGGSDSDLLIGSETTGNTLQGGLGNDVIKGMGGDDILQGGGGNDLLSGGDGLDWVDYTDQTMAMTIRLDLNKATGGSAGLDRFSLVENVRGGAGNDTIRGSAGTNVLEGGGGRDVLTGGDGQDTFQYLVLSDSAVASSARDLIQDFDLLDGDRINLSAIDAVADGSVNQAFRYIGAVDFHDRAGELRSVVSGGNTLVSGDVDGDGAADFSILLKGALTLQAGDFIL